MHDEPSHGDADDKGDSHHFHERQDQLLQHAGIIGAEDFLHGHAANLLLHVIGTHRKEAQGRYQNGKEREDKHDIQHAFFILEAFLDHLLDILAVEHPVGENLRRDGLHPLSSLALITNRLHQQCPWEIIIRALPPVENHGRALCRLQRTDLEIVVHTADGSRAIIRGHEFRSGLVDSYLFESIFIKPPGMLVIVLFHLQAENPEICVVALYLLERHPVSFTYLRG